jgi:hypothetical protein
MWVNKSNLLAPLNTLTSIKFKFEWLSSHQKIVNKVKKYIEAEILP